MPAISMQHDPDTGEWSITTAGQRNVFKVFGYPDCDTWWVWLWHIAPAEGASVLGATVDGVRSDFNTAVASVQSSCQCEPCRDAVHGRQLAKTNATKRTLAYGSKPPRPDRVPLYVQESSEPVAFARISGPPAARTPKQLYEDARTRYMNTGTITDKDAMLDRVTLTVPDLDTIGADWEPASQVALLPSPAEGTALPRPHLSRKRAGWSLVAFAVALGNLGAQLHFAPAIQNAAGALLLIGASVLLWPRQRAHQ